MDDFNPFDLSAPPKKVEEPLHPEVAARPKATVKRVSMGPIFHSRITKVLALVGGIILSALIGYSATNYYLIKKNATNAQSSATTSVQTQKSASNGSAATGDKTEQQTADALAASPTTPSSPSTSAPSSSPTTQPKIYCGVSGMPEGVCTAITSIEKDGAKNNQYVTADTSKLPDGTTIDIDKQSWFQGGPEIGSTKFTGKYSSSTLSGNLFWQQSGGMWKVVSYTLNQ